MPAPAPEVRIRLFQRVLVLAGVPFGSLVGLIAAASPPRSWPDLMFTVLVAGAAFGGGVAAVAVLYVRYIRRSGWTVAAFFGVMGVTGLLVGSTVYFGARWWPHGRWSRLVAPPEPGRSFAGPTCYYERDPVVYLSTTQGRLYALRRNEGWTHSWQAVTGIPPDTGRIAYGCKDHLPQRGRTPWPPGPIEAAYQVDLHGADCGGRHHYLLLKDGSVWEWSTGGCAIGEVMLLFSFLLVGLVLGIVSALAILLLGWAPTWTRMRPVP